MQEPNPMRSYTSTAGTNFFAEVRSLVYRTLLQARNVQAEVQGTIDCLRKCEDLVAQHTGLVLRDCDILEIGPGQAPRQLAYFAIHNRAIGVDMDVIPQGGALADYVQVLRRNGIKRLLKTLGRRAMRLDSRFSREMARQLGVKTMPQPTVVEMDAATLSFPANSYDFVFSQNTFEHLPDPSTVLKRVSEILRPGGVCFIDLHLYSCDNGCHDLRIVKPDDRHGMPYWPHLRLQHKDTVSSFAYLNKLTLAEWRQVFSDVMPGVVFTAERDGEPLPTALKSLRLAGELGDFSDEELLTRNLIAIWQKPRTADT